MRWVQKFGRQYSWIGLIRLCFYPLTTLFTTPIRLVQTLWACRVLADGKWGNYLGFTPHAGLNGLFYWTVALNLYRFGRSGRSPYLGIASYRLSRLFHYSLPSLYAYWVGGTVTVLLGMFGWWLLHLMWISDQHLWWVLLIMGISLISTTFYANTFALQNYNAVGWMFFPLGLYGLLTERWLVAGLAWLTASFGSFTVVFLAGIISLIVATLGWTIAPILAILPAGLKLLTHFWFTLVDGDLKTTLFTIMKALGTTKQNIKYKRTPSSKVRMAHLYYFLMYVQFFLISYWLTGNIPWVFLIGLTIFLVNSTVSRFADLQSMWMLMASLATVTMMQNLEVWLLPSYWVVVSPPPLIAYFPSMKHSPDVVPKLKPFAIKPFLVEMERFLSPVREGQRILMSFKDPGGKREKVFDGYRVLLELPHYVATKNEVYFMPSWRGVSELNYEGAPDFWGRDIDSVLKNVEYWQADYVIIYQETDTTLEPKWEEAGFKVMERFSWANYAKDLGDCKPYSGPTPDWWLLRKPS